MQDLITATPQEDKIDSQDQAFYDALTGGGAANAGDGAGQDEWTGGDAGDVDGERQQAGDKEGGDAPETGGEVTDYTQTVTIADGQKVTIEELKDAFKTQAEMLLTVQERETAVAAQVAKARELAEYLGTIPPHIKAQAEAELAQQEVQERAALVEAIPAWKDPQVAHAGKQAIWKLAESYGIADLVGQIADHRAVKLLHDFATLKAAVEASRAKLKQQKPELHSRNVQKGKATDTDALIARAKETKNPADKDAAFVALLGGRK